ncbi:phospholipase D-like domain-containing protein DpdK [Duganella sp. CT11-25]|uniref:phospholipase D-like domain-containing protein DpdK n=1 Tax=unclassified Duganella TaxID=2636909 RepID=UPI0039AF1080
MSGSPSPARDLFGPEQTGAIRDLLQSLFIAELLKPSSCLWMAFGWISDIEVIDNRARQFGALQPDWPASGIRLSQLMSALVEAGGQLSLVLRDVDHNRQFISAIKPMRERFPGQVKIAVGAEVHDKGILGDDFLLSGSMNLTYNGVTINDEHLTLRTDMASVQEWRLTLEQKWGRALV